MLDHLSETDEKGYQEFIKEQMKNAKEDFERTTFIPVPGFSIKTKQIVEKNIFLERRRGH